MPEFATSRDGTRIAYDVSGDGPPLVYVTGAICSRRFPPVARDTTHFATTFRVLGYDRRGRGDSGDSAPWSVQREVEDIEAMIAEVGGRAYVYGHSSGAVLALHAAHRLGDAVIGVVLYDASWAADEGGAAEYAGLRSSVDRLLDQGRHAAAVRRFLAGIGMPRVFVHLLRFMPGWRGVRALAPTLRYDMELTADPPPLDLASEVRVPVHVVVGERSPAELHDVGRAIAAAVPGATLTILAGQDHMVDASAVLPELERRCPQPAA